MRDFAFHVIDQPLNGPLALPRRIPNCPLEVRSEQDTTCPDDRRRIFRRKPDRVFHPRNLVKTRLSTSREHV